ncbi:hypothetical protein E2N92_13245 [Methanofollis formosanus]|uniref:Uncharacterized protein n=1 Tax=Methanofollis formosanus TaxID=299308 RepID=A0A8G1EGZ9_9EURY|nr:hypothetical protein [Methanofollis formosanus]QYZ80325.1 hypothetical protein E2N92_13245 [Methanofollis formosanus]
MREQDEAVSSVVGLMLVLAIIATVLAIYSATYLPGLKQQSEIVHTHEVQDAFARFGGEIEHAVAQKSWCRLSESFALGGGDVLLSPGKSSGTLLVSEGEPLLAEVFFNEIEGAASNASLVSIAYQPSFTTWEPQGYTWQYGYINVTKGEKETPLHDYTMDEVKAPPFARSFVEIRDESPQGSGACTNLTVTLVKMHPGDKATVTGNGMANLCLVSTVPEPEKKETDYLEVRVNKDIALPEFASAVNQSVVTACTALADYPNVQYDSGALRFSAPVTVTVRTVDIEVNAR